MLHLESMAMALESVGSILSHASSSSSPSAHIAPPTAQASLAFSRCSGLRITSAGRVLERKKVPASSRASSRGIVCEKQQETITPVGAVNDKTWKKLVLESDIPVLVDFWAPWCGPCRMIAPLVDELAKEYAGRIRCLKLNTDESPTTATEYGIRSIPTVMIFKQGLKKDTVIGAVPKATLMATIEKFLDR